MENLSIQVSNEDIANGKTSNCKECPIALAILRTVENVRCVTVSYTYTLVTFNDGVRKGYNNNNAARLFIDMFDKGQAVQPVNLSLQLEYTYKGL